MVLINSRKKHLLGILIRNVLDHQSSSFLFVGLDSINIQLVLLLFLIFLLRVQLMKVVGLDIFSRFCSIPNAFVGSWRCYNIRWLDWASQNAAGASGCCSIAVWKQTTWLRGWRRRSGLIEWRISYASLCACDSCCFGVRKGRGRRHTRRNTRNYNRRIYQLLNQKSIIRNWGFMNIFRYPPIPGMFGVDGDGMMDRLILLVGPGGIVGPDMEPWIGLVLPQEWVGELLGPMLVTWGGGLIGLGMAPGTEVFLLSATKLARAFWKIK